MKRSCFHILAYSGCALCAFILGTVAAARMPVLRHWWREPNYGWSYAARAEVPSGISIDGDSLLVLRMKEGSDVEPWPAEQRYREHRPNCVLRVSLAPSGGLEPWVYYFETREGAQSCFEKETADTTIFKIDGALRLRMKEEIIRSDIPGHFGLVTRWHVTRFDETAGWQKLKAGK